MGETGSVQPGWVGDGWDGRRASGGWCTLCYLLKAVSCQLLWEAEMGVSSA